MGGKHEIRHTNEFKEEEFNLTGSHAKPMSELFQGGGGGEGEIFVSVHIFACEDEHIKFCDFHVHNLSYITRQITRKQEQ